jgi:hypothetical protein
VTFGFSVAGTAGANFSGTVANCTVSPLANDTVLTGVFFSNHSTNNACTVVYDTDTGGANMTMTAVGSPFLCLNTSGTQGYLQFFYLQGVSAATNVQITATSAGTTPALKLGAVSYSGVDTVTAGTSTTALNALVSTVTLPSFATANGNIAVGLLFAINTITTFTMTAGTQRLKDLSTWGLIIADVAATGSTATFTATESAASRSGIIYVNLAPLTGATIAPTSIGSGESVGSPTVTPGTVSVAPASIPSQEAVGTPALGQDGTVAPASIPSQEAVGTPAISLGTWPIALSGIPSAESFGTPGVTGGLLDITIAKLLSATSTTVLAGGDSTAWGAFDDGAVHSGTPWTPPTMYGWPGRLYWMIARWCNANLDVYMWNYPTNTGYVAARRLFTASGASPPTLTLYLAGWPGGIASLYLGKEAAMFPVSNPDLIIWCSNFNATNVTTEANNYATLVQDIQTTLCPGVPMLITTQNATTIAQESGHVVTFAQIWTACLAKFLSSSPSLPLSPSYQKSDLYEGLYLYDTRNALPLTSGDLYVDGLHPVGSGYWKEAVGLLYALSPYVAQLIAPSGIPSSEVFGTPAIVPGGVSLVPSGITSAEGIGTPLVSLGDVAVIAPEGIPSASWVGTPLITPGEVSVSPSSIPTVEAVGHPVVDAPPTGDPVGVVMSVQTGEGVTMTLEDAPS